MSWFNYVMKTPLTEIYADWKTFQKLRRKYDKALDQRDYRQYKMLSEGINPCMDRIPTGHKYTFITQYKMKYCKNFFTKKCSKSCEKYKVHNEYWKFYDDANSLKMQIAEFWGKKFQKAK